MFVFASSEIRTRVGLCKCLRDDSSSNNWTFCVIAWDSKTNLRRTTQAIILPTRFRSTIMRGSDAEIENATKQRGFCVSAFNSMWSSTSRIVGGNGSLLTPVPGKNVTHADVPIDPALPLSLFYLWTFGNPPLPM